MYQIYPASFQDSNADGIGDIPGIISRLDYLKDLGVDAIWISPFFSSPQVDMGYDVSDYENVYPAYGTVADVEQCIRETHIRGMKIIFDLVVNHTSDQHKWFQESRQSKASPKRDWYIWRPAKYVDGIRCPPNNWKAHFGGSVWAWDEQTEEYYLHYFAPEQPDLNWESEDCRNAIYDSAMRFWLDKGCDGFRIDTVNMYSKFLDFPDAEVTEPGAKYQFASKYYSNGPRLHEFLREMNHKVLSRYNCMTVGESPRVLNKQQLLAFVGASQKELNMVFEFELAEIDSGMPCWKIPKKWQLTELKNIVSRSQSYLDDSDGWVTNYLENHDRARAVSRFGNDSPEYRRLSATMLATFWATLSGTNFLHQGGEIGMINAPTSWEIEEYKDLDSQNFYAEELCRNQGNEHMKSIMAGLRHTARDHGRLPMQWSGNSHAGFTDGTPWMRVHDEYRSLNVENQAGDPDSVLNYYKNMLQLRKLRKEFTRGTFRLYGADDQAAMIYTKTYEGQITLVALNWTAERQTYDLPEEFRDCDLKRLVGNDTSMVGVLKAYEATIYALQ